MHFSKSIHKRKKRFNKFKKPKNKGKSIFITVNDQKTAQDFFTNKFIKKAI